MFVKLINKQHNITQINQQSQLGYQDNYANYNFPISDNIHFLCQNMFESQIKIFATKNQKFSQLQTYLYVKFQLKIRSQTFKVEALMSIKKRNSSVIQALQYIRKVQTQHNSMDRIQFSIGEMDNSIVDKKKRLRQIYLKHKINYLVGIFIEKLRRNIKPKNRIKYHRISNILMMKQGQEQQTKTMHMPDLIKLAFLIINTVCVFIIQAISLWQGLLDDYRQNVSENTVIEVLKAFSLVVFVIKIGLSLTIQNLVSESLFLKFRKLAKFYIASWVFIFDICFCILSLLLIILPKSQILGIISFLISTSSIIVLYRNLKIIQTDYIDSYKKKQYWNLFQVLIFNMWSLQIFAFIVLAMSFYDDYYNWIQKAIRIGNMELNPPWFVKYIYSIYWIVCALASLGFGDLTEASYIQCICMAFIVYSGFFALSYNVIEVFHIISNIRSIDWQKNYDTMIFKRMVKKQKINNPKLQQQILNFIAKSAAIKNEPQFLKISQFLQKMPPKLKGQFKQEVSKGIFTKIPFFQFLDIQTLNSLADKIQRQIYYSGQYIPEKHQKIANIIILKHGKIGLAYNRSNSTKNGSILEYRDINELQDSPYLLNQYLLSPNKQVSHDVIAKSYCYLYTINLQGFKDSLRQNSRDYELYFEMHNKFNYIQYEWNKFQCQFCLKKRHSVFQCPKLHYMPYKSLKVHKHILSKGKIQLRDNKFKRKHPFSKKKKSLLFWKSYFKLHKINQQAQQYDRQYKNAQHFKLEEQKHHKHRHSNTRPHNSQELINTLYEQMFFYSTQIEEYPLEILQQMDKMNNFQFFFKKNNPDRLKILSLKSKPKIKVVQDYAKSETKLI